jgi:uncharacterized protein (DUF2164 family)
VILIQRIKKIKEKSFFKEILVDTLFFLGFFIFGVIFVFSHIKGREERAFLLQNQKESVKIENNSIDMEQDFDFVASSRGKYFYEIGSSRANGLSEKNKVYFKTPEEAKNLGFKPYFEG